MKIKQNVYISNEEMFLRNPKSECYAMCHDRHMDDTWIFCDEVVFEVGANDGEIIERVSDKIDTAVADLEAKVLVLKNRKAELLALPSPDEPTTHDEWMAEAAEGSETSL